MSKAQVQSDYLERVFDPECFGQTIAKTLQVARRVMEKNPFDSIAFTGVSGAALAFILAAELKVSLLCIRKPGENSHFHRTSNDLLEGYLGAKKYLFVDDFISSGETYRSVVNLLQEKMPYAECVGALTYAALGRDSYAPVGNMKLPVYSVEEYYDLSWQAKLPFYRY